MDTRRYALPIVLLILAIGAAGVILFALSYYTSESYLTLEGDSEITIGLNGVYEEPGYDAVLHGRDANDKVTVEGKADPRVPGDYTIRYHVGHFSVERTVTVLSEMDPVLTLEGGSVTMKLGDSYEEPGYTAEDEDGTDLTSSVVVNDADLNRAGRQKIVYTVSDADGNTTRVSRSVVIQPNTEYETSGIPICMFHYVYDANNRPAKLNGNYISTESLSEELAFLKEENFYFPTWQEVRDYVEGKLLLPEKSVVLTFDDGSYSFLDNGIPLLEQCQVPATSFLITGNQGEKKVAKYQSDYVTFQSHSHNMHRGGGKIGHGGIFTVESREEGLADLRKSIEIVGSADAFAYPFGDTNESSRQIVEEAGFLCAVTTVPGRAKPGDDPLMLPRQRMVRTQSLASFSYMVMPLSFDKDND